MGVKIALMGSKKAFFCLLKLQILKPFWPSKYTVFFTYFPPYWPYMMMGHVGGPPWYLYKESMLEGALSGPIETKCLMYVNARSMVITDQQAALRIYP